MSESSKIEWTDATWNPVVGCSMVSPACTNCYAMAMAARIERMTPGSHYAGTTETVKGKAVWTGTLKQAPDDVLLKPLKWKKQRRIFVNSMSDLFHENVPDEWLDRIFAVMALAPQHTFQVLTKRPKRMRDYASNPRTPHRIARAVVDMWSAKQVAPDDNWPVQSIGDIDIPDDITLRAWPLPNVWLGVTAEDQPRADERIPDLLATPAAVRFVSCEPLLSWIDFENIDYPTYLRTLRPGSDVGLYPCDPIIKYDVLRGHMKGPDDIGLPRLDWVITGGESGPDARPSHPDLFRGLRDQCVAADVPFFFKQWGEWHTAAVRLGDGAAVFRRFDSFQQWVNKASTWVNGGICLDKAGRILRNGGDMAHARDEGLFPATIMHRVGKRRAGRLLDGVEHSAFPEPRA